MALDESLLISAGEKKQPPTLRLYDWESATLSLGFAQPINDVNLSALQESGWGIVRRPTGGRAILHVDELTYSITAPADEPPLAGSLLDSYQLISNAILNSLEHLGVQACNEKENKRPEQHQKAPVCFETPSNYEIISSGRKLVGSAQARKYNGLLQHGSLPLHGDLTRINRVIKFNIDSTIVEADKRLLEHAITLESVLGKVISTTSTQNAFIRGFAETFGIEWLESQPTREEITRAETLVQTKYSTEAWTYRL